MSESKASMTWNENQDLGDYRTISKSAVLAVFAALASITAFATPVLWLVPAVSILIALISMRQIRRNNNLAGGGAAFVALLLSIFFLFAAPARSMSRRQKLTSIGRQHVDKWVALVKQGKLPQAYELTLNYSDRSPVGADLDKLYGPNVIELNIADSAMRQEAINSIRTKEEDLHQFFGRGAAKIIATTNAQPKFVGMVASGRRFNVDTMSLRYELTFQRDGKQVTDDFEFEIERMLHPELQESHWRIAALKMETNEPPLAPLTVNVVQPSEGLPDEDSSISEKTDTEKKSP